MNEGARFLLSLGAAVGLHAAVLPGLPGGGGGGGGEGGANAISVVAADGTVEAMLARWQATPDVDPPPHAAPEPAADPMLPAVPSPTASRMMALPQSGVAASIAPDTPIAAAPPPIRVFDALPEIETPQAMGEPALLPALPTLPTSSLVHPLALARAMHPAVDEAVPLPSPDAVPERDFAPLPPFPVPQVADRPRTVNRPLPEPTVAPPSGLAALPRVPQVESPADGLPVIAPPPLPVAQANPVHPPLDRTPIPPRRPERAVAQAHPSGPPPTPQTAQPPTQSRTSPQTQGAAAPALAARGQGGGAHAGNGGGAAAAGDPAAQRSALARWGAQIRARVERHAQRQRGRGSVALVLRVSTSGTLESVALRQGSGDPDLDQAAMSAARAAGPFLSAPDTLGSGTHAFGITLTFRR